MLPTSTPRFPRVSGLWLRRASAWCAVTLTLSSVVLVHSDASHGATARAPKVTTQWYEYHGDSLGSGVAVGLRSVSTTTPAWTSRLLDGQIYGSPLVYAKEVIVATENNSVYALSAATGRVVWSHHLAPVVPARDLPCGDIDPTVGITGTPVIEVIVPIG